MKFLCLKNNNLPSLYFTPDFKTPIASTPNIKVAKFSLSYRSLSGSHPLAADGESEVIE